MTGRLLDLSVLPFDQTYICRDGSKIVLRDFLDDHYEVIQALAATGHIKANESFGFAMAVPEWGGESSKQFMSVAWDKPEKFIWFVGGWGPNRDRYIANAIRKMRVLLRPGDFDIPSGRVKLSSSTLDIRYKRPEHFLNPVESMNPDGTFSWGDFPYGGAAFVEMGELVLAGAVSALTELEDDMVVKLILSDLANRLLVGNGMTPGD